MEQYIKEYIENNHYVYTKINSNKDIDNIYQLYKNNIIVPSESDIVNMYYGLYFGIKNDYDKMIKYYLMAIDKGNSTAMTNLGTYYKAIKDYNNMMKYYQMAISKVILRLFIL